jgi:N-acyl-D-aspartate/D-glutamate deacylase
LNFSLQGRVRIVTRLKYWRVSGEERRIDAASGSGFDPARVVDRATFDNPAQYSEGIPYVLVHGVFVVKEGQVQDGAPGRGLRR